MEKLFLCDTCQLEEVYDVDVKTTELECTFCIDGTLKVIKQPLPRLEEGHR